jgi:hypothetical protein
MNWDADFAGKPAIELPDGRKRRHIFFWLSEKIVLNVPILFLTGAAG